MTEQTKHLLFLLEIARFCHLTFSVLFSSAAGAMYFPLKRILNFWSQHKTTILELGYFTGLVYTSKNIYLGAAEKAVPVYKLFVSPLGGLVNIYHLFTLALVNECYSATRISVATLQTFLTSYN